MFDVEEYADSGIPKTYLIRLSKCLTSCICNATHDNEDDEWYFYDGENHCEFYYLLEELEIPEKYKEKIADTVRCPSCGCELTLESEVCYDFTLEEQEKYLATLNKLSRNSKPLIDDFFNYLCRYPYLGAKHSTGKKLIKGIDELKRISIDNEIFYRARLPENERVFTQKDMEAPPVTVKISEGRFNHYGQSHFYVGSSEEVCAVECSHDKNCICWMQKVKINHIENVSDLTESYFQSYFSPEVSIPDLPLAITGLLMSGTITASQKTEGSWKPEYFVPRFISDACKEKGIQGILYPSSFMSGMKNLVIFNFNELDFEFLEDPYIFTYKRPNF